MKDILDIKGNLSGKLSFYYSPKPNNYDLNKQTIDLVSDENQLEGVFYMNKDKILLDINGIVKHAKISHIDLFPTFSGWFRNDPYVVFAYIITTVFSGVALLKR